MQYSDEDENYYSSSNSLDDDSVSDEDVQPIPYWDVVRHGSKFASYRFVIVYPDGSEDDEPAKASSCEPSIREEGATILTVLPGRVRPDDWGCRLRAPAPPPEKVESTPPPPPSDDRPVWESHRLHQSLGMSIPPPPPVEQAHQEEEDWCVIRSSKGNKRSLLRNNIAPIQRNNDNTTDRKDLLCKLSHRSGSCQRAHNMSEWRPKECRRNACRQTNCSMLHPATEDRVKLLNRLIGIQGTFYHQHAQDFKRLYLDTPNRRSSSDRPPSRRGRGGRGSRR